MGRWRSTIQSGPAGKWLTARANCFGVRPGRTWQGRMKAILAALLTAAALTLPAHAQDGAAGIAQDYEPDPAIWVLADDDTRIYLLGTIHVLPEGFRWRSERLDGIVAEADELVVESTEKDLGASSQQLAAMIASVAKRPPVSERLSPGNGWKWLALGESLGIPPEQFDRVPPIMAIFGIGTTANQQETGSTQAFGVETVLEADFAAAGKPIRSIENAADILAALLEMNEAVLIKELDRELSRWNGKDAAALLASAPAKGGQPVEALAVEHAWARGAEMDVRDELTGGTAFGSAIGKLLLDNRNRAWAGWLEDRLAEPGTLLVAVGAGHLAGENSLHAMLAKRGLATQRLN